MKIWILLLLICFLTGCGGSPNPGPSIGAGLAIIGLSLIVMKLVERIRENGGDHE